MVMMAFAGSVLPPAVTFIALTMPLTSEVMVPPVTVPSSFVSPALSSAI